MRRDRRLFLLLELILGILAAVLLVLMFRPAEERRRIAVIVSDSDSNGWDHFILGMKQAAQENSADLVIVGTGTITRASDERSLILRTMDDGADALIVQPAPGLDTEAMLEETAGTVPVVLVPDGLLQEKKNGEDTDVPDTGGADSDSSETEETGAAGTGDSPFPVIGPDFYRMGEDLAVMLLEDYAGSLEGKKIGIANHTRNTEAARDAEAGLIDGLSESGCEVVWTLRGMEHSSDPEQELSNQKEADIVAALNTECTEAAGEAAAEQMLHGAVVYGITSSERSLYDLDHDDVRGLVFLNGYDMGYRCVLEISQKLDSRFYKMQGEETPWMPVRREDLFKEENEDVLFMPQ